MIADLCNTVINGVIATGVVNEENIDHAVEVIRNEVKAFLYGEEYENERACAYAGTVPDAYIVRMVILNATGKIRNV